MKRILQIQDSMGQEYITLLVSTSKEWEDICLEVEALLDRYNNDTNYNRQSFETYLLNNVSFDFERVNFCSIALDM